MFNHNNLKEIADNAGLELREYSGRGMYGRKCVGINCADTMETLGELIAACESTDTAAHLIRTLKQDSMGLDAIVYWPRIEWSDDVEFGEKEDEDEDEDESETV